MSKNHVSREDFNLDVKKDLEIYKKYREILFSQDVSDRRDADYNWRPLLKHKSLDILYWRYNIFSNEFCIEITNYINSLVANIYRISAWKTLLDEIVDQYEKLDIFDKFVITQTYYSLSLPYIIKQKIIFAFCHLCHQIRILKNPNQKDDLVADRGINIHTLEKFKGDSITSDNLIEEIKSISSENFSEKTLNFRNGLNHRITPAIEIGKSGFITREINPDKSVLYGISTGDQISLEKSINALKEEIEIIFVCYDLFKEMVHEHEEWIIRDMSC